MVKEGNWKNPVTVFALLASAVGLLAIGTAFWLVQPSDEYASLRSPDGRFRLDVRKFRYEGFIPKSIGGGGDAQGFVFLFDASGREIARAPIELVNMIWSVRWASDSVSLPCVFDWPLPP